MICDGFNVCKCGLIVLIIVSKTWNFQQFVSCQLFDRAYLIIGIVVVIMNHHQWGHIKLREKYRRKISLGTDLLGLCHPRTDIKIP